ncbi:MAG: TerB family tellurite resistance protein [Puia sp.]|nr:TerB family tellurite resistance protein [Puia sp.]
MKNKIIVLFLACMVFGSRAHSQSIIQLATQLALDIEKLSELKSILSEMYKAYTIIDKGYKDVESVVSGNFNLHKAFLDALLAVSPAVQNYPRIVDIINAEYNVVSEYRSASSKFNADGHFTPQELSYIANLYSTILNKSAQCITQLTMVITANQMRMNDAERLNSIDRIYDDITATLSHLRTFNSQTSVQAIQRSKEAGDLSTLQNIYGIN